MYKHKLNVTQIYNYLTQKNFNLTSDRVLRQPHNNHQIIWNIFVFLSSHLKDSKYQQIQPTLQYLINTEQHKNSIKKIKQYIVLTDVMSKIQGKVEDYPIREILKPERENVIERLNLLISANKFVEKVNRDYEPQITEMRMKRQAIGQLKRKLEIRSEQIQQIRIIKQQQKNQYQQKVQNIQNLNKDLNYKKKQKLDIINSMQVLQNELKKKTKQVQQNGYIIDDLNLKIKQLQRQVIKNAPKLKKQRYTIMQQLQNLIKNKKQLTQFWQFRITQIKQKLKNYNNIKQKTKTYKIQNIKNQNDKLYQELNQLLSQLKNQQDNKNHTNQLKKEKLTSIQNHQKIKQQSQQTLIQTENQLLILEKAKNNLEDEQRKHNLNISTLEEKNYQSINQYRILQGKIQLRREKIHAEINKIAARWADIQDKSRTILHDTFIEFN